MEQELTTYYQKASQNNLREEVWEVWSSFVINYNAHVNKMIDQLLHQKGIDEI